MNIKLVNAHNILQNQAIFYWKAPPLVELNQ